MCRRKSSSCGDAVGGSFKKVRGELENQSANALVIFRGSKLRCLRDFTLILIFRDDLRMCGILLEYGPQLQPTPKFIENGLDPKHVVLHRQQIAQLVGDYISRVTELTPADADKIANLSKLRDLQNRLEKCKSSRNYTAADEFQSQIDQLSRYQDPKIDFCLFTEILARGPDYALFTEFEIASKSIRVLSSVLSLRQPFVPQPLDTSGFLIQFNGELYNEEVMHGNDTDFVGELLQKHCRSCSRAQAILLALETMEGEFAVVIIDRQEDKIYFAKDSVGKRSLLWKRSSDGLYVSSVGMGGTEECLPGVLHIYDCTSSSLLTQTFKLIEGNTDSKSAPSWSACELAENLKQTLKQSCLLRQLAIDVPGNNGLAILFSGGLDCTTLAYLIAQNYAEAGVSMTIDLLTVGFENPRTGLSAQASPDRQLSERSFLELGGLFNETLVNFRLVLIDVLYEKWLSHRRRVLRLISPKTTEMDLSIAVAFYFASCARDCSAKVFTNSEIVESDMYTSAAKVLISGLGADELFGGYSRHENIFSSLKENEDTLEMYRELHESLEHDIQVIYERNLGRDDRAMSCWGKEIRYPFLSPAVITLAQSSDDREKVVIGWEEVERKKGKARVKVITRKNILRVVTAALGVEYASREQKRAIQFGAKSAKMEIGQSKTRGTDFIGS